MRGLIVMFIFVFGVLASSLALRFTWDQQFNMCGVQLHNCVNYLCNFKLQSVAINTQKQTILNTCCKHQCSFRQMKFTYCANNKVETDFPPFVNENDSAWVRIMNAKTVLDKLGPVVTTPMPVSTYQKFGFSEYAFGRQHYPGSQYES